MSKQLYRNEQGKMIGGVCAGIGDYFGIDYTLARVIFVVLAIINGAGVLIYILLWILLPARPALPYDYTGPEVIRDSSGNPVPGEPGTVPPPRSLQGNIIGGIVLIVIGMFFLLEVFIPDIRIRDYWPVLIIVAGILLLISAVKRKKI